MADASLVGSSLPPQAVAPTLVFGVGNPSRGDDAVGPMLIERLQQRQEAGGLRGVDLLTDFQLQVEHALDLIDRQRVIFVDAAVGLRVPFCLSAIEPAATLSWTTHSLTPAGLVRLYRSLYGDPPRMELLAIGAERFELGSPLSQQTEINLEAATRGLLSTLGDADSSGPATPVTTI